MSTMRLIGMAVAAAAMVTLAACQTQETRTASPGALPTGPSGVAPQIDASTYAAHGELLERRGDLARAAQQYRRALELSPKMHSVRNRLGVTLNKLGMHAEATAEFRRVLLKQPTEAHVHNNLGFSLYLEGKYDEAEPVLVHALELDPGFRRARMNHGLVLAKLGRYDAALEEFTQAGDVADAHFNVAVVQAEAGDYAAAAQSLEQALRHNPKLDAARDHLRQISRLAAAQDTAAHTQTEGETVKIAAEQQRVAEVAAAAAAEAALADATPAGDLEFAAAVDSSSAASPTAPVVVGNDAAPATDTPTNNSAPTSAPPEMLTAAPLEAVAGTDASEDFQWRIERLRERIGSLLNLAVPQPRPDGEVTDGIGLMQHFEQLLEDLGNGAPDAVQSLAEWEQRWGLDPVGEPEVSFVGPSPN